MTLTSAIRKDVAVPVRGRRDRRVKETWPAAPAPEGGRKVRTAPKAAPPRPRARGGAGEIAAAVLLLVAWALLWTFFLDGVAVPAGHLEAALPRHPSVYPAAAPAGPGDGRPVDRAMSAP